MDYQTHRRWSRQRPGHRSPWRVLSTVRPANSSASQASSPVVVVLPVAPPHQQWSQQIAEVAAADCMHLCNRSRSGGSSHRACRCRCAGGHLLGRRLGERPCMQRCARTRPALALLVRTRRQSRRQSLELRHVESLSCAAKSPPASRKPIRDTCRQLPSSQCLPTNSWWLSCGPGRLCPACCLALEEGQARCTFCLATRRRTRCHCRSCQERRCGCTVASPRPQA